MCIFVAVILTFLVSLLIFRGILQLFIFRKIKNITLQIKSHRTFSNSDVPARTSISELEQQVKEWLEEHNEEKQQLQKLENYRKEFLGNVFHELKTPVFNIQGYISTLLDGGIDDTKINKEYLKRAEKSVDRMIAIVEDLQTLTQLEKGELELEEEEFDIVALAKDVMDSQEIKAKERKISLELINNLSLPIIVIADKFRIRQVLVNLIVNSIRYGNENGKTTSVISDAGEKIIVEVADTGIGIPKEHLPRIFERFYRVDKSRSRVQGGTGLGLAIVKHILEAHGQTINVMSTEGVGSVVSFTLKKK